MHLHISYVCIQSVIHTAQLNQTVHTHPGSLLPCKSISNVHHQRNMAKVGNIPKNTYREYAQPFLLQNKLVSEETCHSWAEYMLAQQYFQKRFR